MMYHPIKGCKVDSEGIVKNENRGQIYKIYPKRGLAL